MKQEIAVIAKEANLSKKYVDPFLTAQAQIRKFAEDKAKYEVTGLDQTGKMIEAGEIRKQVKKIRTTAVGEHKSLKADVLKFSNALDLMKRTVEQEAQDLETFLQAQEKYVEIQEENRRLELQAERTELVSQYDTDPTVWDLGRLSEDQFNGILDNLELAKQARIQKEKEEKEAEEREQKKLAIFKQRTRDLANLGINTASLAIIEKLEENPTDEQFEKIKSNLLKKKEAEYLARVEEEKAQALRTARHKELKALGYNNYEHEELHLFESEEYQELLARAKAHKKAKDKEFQEQKEREHADLLRGKRSEELRKLNFTDYKYTELHKLNEQEYKKLKIRATSEYYELKEKERRVAQAEKERQEKEAEEKARRSAPDKEKLKAYMKDLQDTIPPEVDSAQAKKIVKNVQILLDKIEGYVNEKAQEL